MHCKKLIIMSIFLIPALIVSCRPRNQGHSNLLDATKLDGSIRWSFDGSGGLLVPNYALADFEGPLTEIRPGVPRNPGSSEGNCHGGSCGSGPNGGFGDSDDGVLSASSGGNGGTGSNRPSSNHESNGGSNDGQPFLYHFLKAPFQIAEALYSQLDVLSQDLGVVLTDNIGTIFGDNRRRRRQKEAERIRAEIAAENQRIEAEKQRFDKETLAYNENLKWLNEALNKANEDSKREIKEEHFDRAIKDAESLLEQSKNNRQDSPNLDVFLGRSDEYAADLLQEIIVSAQKHNEEIDKYLDGAKSSSPQESDTAIEYNPGAVPPNTPEGKRLEEVKDYIQFVATEVERDPNLQDEKRKLVNIAESCHAVAAEEFAAGNFPAGDFALNLATTALDLALSLTPGIGVAKDIYEGLSGKNLLTGEKLTTIERALSIVNIATGGLAPVILKTSVGIVAIGKVLKRSAKTVEEVDVAAKSVGKALDVLDSAKKFGAKTAEETKDFIQTAEGVLGKDIATAGKLENLVDTASSLAKDLKFTETTIKRMEDAARYVPRETLAEAIKFGKKMPDPQGAAGAERYVIDMFKNGKKYELEVVYRESDSTILHFLYK